MLRTYKLAPFLTRRMQVDPKVTTDGPIRYDAYRNSSIRLTHRGLCPQLFRNAKDYEYVHVSNVTHSKSVPHIID